MALKKAKQVLKEHGYVDVSFNSNAFQECVNRIVEEAYQESQGDAYFYIQPCRLRNAPEDIKDLGFDENEVYSKSHTGYERYDIRALQVDDQYFDAALQLLRMYDYKLVDRKDMHCWQVWLT